MKKQPSNWIEGMAMELKEKRHQMKDPLQELMTITMEECGEPIRCGNYYDNTELLEEVADVYTMLELMHEYDLISFNDVDILVERKKEKLKKWSNLL